MTAIDLMVADRHRLLTRATQTLLGICTGLVADGQINDGEIHFLKTWLRENEETLKTWPGDIIGQRVDAILQDGAITEAERTDFLQTLQAMTGNHFAETGAAAPDNPNQLPVDDSCLIAFKDAQFCLTGKFIYGTRAACQRTILSLGGIVSDRVGQNLDYLVIGSLINPTWAYEAHGRKIEEAVAMQKKNERLRIVSEAHWTKAIAALIK